MIKCSQKGSALENSKLIKWYSPLRKLECLGLFDSASAFFFQSDLSIVTAAGVYFDVKVFDTSTEENMSIEKTH